MDVKVKGEDIPYSFSGSGGIRLVALKFVEEDILLYTPDPNGCPEPPPDEGIPIEFNITWLCGGHPLLNVGDLSIEASQRLILLLDQLRFTTVKSLTSLVIVVLINSLSAIAKKQPAYYGRILPVLLSLDPPSFVIKGVHVYGAHHALKNALLSCLKCTHARFAPWRDRLHGALRKMKAGGLAELALNHVHKINDSVEEEKDDSSVIKEEKFLIKACDAVGSNVGRKRSGTEDSSDLAENDDDLLRILSPPVRLTLEIQATQRRMQWQKNLKNHLVLAEVPETQFCRNLCLKVTLLHHCLPWVHKLPNLDFRSMM